jgi:hypothetical protein
LNVQAACDASCQFLFLGILALGVTGGDNKALQNSKINDFIATQIPHGYYLIGDNVDAINNHFLITYSGSEKI